MDQYVVGGSLSSSSCKLQYKSNKDIYWFYFKFVYAFIIIMLVAITKDFNKRSTGKEKRFTVMIYRME